MTNRFETTLRDMLRRRRLVLLLAAMVLMALALGACSDGDSDEAEGAEDDDSAAADGDSGEDSDGESASGDGDGETINLRYAFYAPAFPELQMEQWAERVAEETDGRVEVEIFSRGTLLGADEMYSGTVEGVADIGLGSPNLDTGRFPMLSAVTLPVDFPNAVVSSRTMLALIEEFEFAELDGFEVLVAFTGEPGYVQSIDRIETLEDVNGKEIRVTGAGVDVLRALGAVPVPMPMPEVPESLQTGVIEGVMTSREVIEIFGLSEFINYVVDKPISTGVTFAALMPTERFESLPEDVQELFLDLREEFSVIGGELADEQAASGVEFAREGGIEFVELSDEEEARWDERLDPIVNDWIEEMESQGLPGQEVVDRMLELRDEFAAEGGS